MLKNIERLFVLVCGNSLSANLHYMQIFKIQIYFETVNNFEECVQYLLGYYLFSLKFWADIGVKNYWWNLDYVFHYLLIQYTLTWLTSICRDTSQFSSINFSFDMRTYFSSPHCFQYECAFMYMLFDSRNVSF